jgi:hypothetical protein
MVSTNEPTLRFATLRRLQIRFWPHTTGTAPPSEVLLHLPPLGLAASETAQVNVVNTLRPPPNGGVAPFCSGTVVFYDSRGGVVGQIRPFQLESAQMFSTPLDFASASPSGQRTAVLAVICLSPFKVTSDAGAAVTPCSITSSLETFDTVTGVTHAVVTGTASLTPANVQVNARLAQTMIPGSYHTLQFPPAPWSRLLAPVIDLGLLRSYQVGGGSQGSEVGLEKMTLGERSSTDEVQ